MVAVSVSIFVSTTLFLHAMRSRNHPIQRLASTK